MRPDMTVFLPKPIEDELLGSGVASRGSWAFELEGAV